MTIYLSYKKLSVSKKFIQKRLKSLENITSSEGIMLRTNRSIQVEGAFGVLKEDHGFRRFLTNFIQLLLKYLCINTFIILL